MAISLLVRLPRAAASLAAAAILLASCGDSSRPDATRGMRARVLATVPNLKVAFIGDQGLTPDSRLVLQLIRDEGADMVLHSGDFDYLDDPDAWDRQIDDVLGPSFPYFASVGNHDVLAWPAYQAKLQARLARIPEATCAGVLGVQSACTYRGLFFLLVGQGTMGSGHELYIRNQLAQDDSLWSVCSWHKNQQLMQVGDKLDETGWGVYEECRLGGGIVATAHEHSYSATHLLDNFQAQSIASTSPVLTIERGKTFAFVSGLGGESVRPQLLDGPWWASIYTATQGASSGALFCTFHVDGLPEKARCSFKNITGAVVHPFELLSAVGNPITSQKVVVAAGPDDAELCVSSGVMTPGSTDLELVGDTPTCAGGTQEVGLRFQNVVVPWGATITSATIQFTVDETSPEPTSLTFTGQAIDDAPGFTTAANDIASRARTVASVAWGGVPAWSAADAAGPDQRTPNLAPVIQEIVDRPGWTPGNDLVLFVAGTGRRTAYAFNGSRSKAPLLALEWTAGGDPPANWAPVARAGADETLTDANGDGTEPAILDGSGSSDLDGTIVAYEWREGATVLATTAIASASFPLGSHAVTLTVTDDQGATATDGLVVTVAAPVTAQSVRVAAGADDAEECLSNGGMYVTSTDLELESDLEMCAGGSQEIGLRFRGVVVPAGATITAASIQFTVDEVTSEPTSLTIWGEAVDDAATFTAAAGGVSGRAHTAAAVTWNAVPAWSALDAAGADQRTPDLAPVIQEIVSRPGWASGNDLVILIGGSGRRTAHAYDGVPALAPLLALEWTNPGPPPNRPPVASAGADRTLTDADGDGVEPALLDGSASSDADGTIVGYEWREGATPLATAASATLSFAVGTHTVILTVTDDQGATATDTLVVTVNPLTAQSVRVAAGADDAEECLSSRAVHLTSTDLELQNDLETCAGGGQQVGLRFRNVLVPVGATITTATVQFSVDEVTTEPTSLTVWGQAIDDAPAFTTAAGSVSSRPRTAASVAWTDVPAWSTLNAAGAARRTPDLAAVVQEIVSRPGWRPGNDIVILIGGTGRRTAWAFNGALARAPLLGLEWTPGP